MIRDTRSRGLAFGIGDVQRLIGLHDAAAPDAEDQSALGEWSKVAASSAMRRGLASGSTWHAGPDLILSVRAAIAVPRISGWQRGRAVVEMQFASPSRPGVFLAGVDDHVDPGGEAFGLAGGPAAPKLVINAYPLNGIPSRSYPTCTGCRGGAPTVAVLSDLCNGKSRGLHTGRCHRRR